MRNEGKKNERRSTPPSFGILLLPRQIGSEHVLNHKLPSKQTKRKKDGFQLTVENIGHHRLHEAEEEEALERLSLFFFLSLSVGKKYTLQEGTASDSFCAVYHSVQRSQRCVIIVSITSFHQKGERERERSEISLFYSRTAREHFKRAGRDTKQKTSLFSCSFVFVSKTGS